MLGVININNINFAMKNNQTVYFPMKNGEEVYLTQEVVEKFERVSENCIIIKRELEMSFLFQNNDLENWQDKLRKSFKAEQDESKELASDLKALSLKELSLSKSEANEVIFPFLKRSREFSEVVENEYSTTKNKKNLK